MLPKRKLIKKRHSRPQPPQQDLQELHSVTLLEKLKSLDSSLQEEALTYISNLSFVNLDNFEEGILG